MIVVVYTHPDDGEVCQVEGIQHDAHNGYDGSNYVDKRRESHLRRQISSFHSEEFIFIVSFRFYPPGRGKETRQQDMK